MTGARDAPGAVTETGLRIGVLGQLVATRDGAPLELGGPRQRAVLALLVLARGDVVPADRLVDALWGEATPPSATSALQAYVSHLRKRMEPDRGPRDRQSVIARQGPGYALRVDDDAVDAWRFERLLRQAGSAEPATAVHLLEDALELWRGPAYADHAGEAWSDGEVSRLAGLRDVAREQLIEARLNQGESAVLVPEIENLVAEDPLREERWRLLVLALYRAHRQADALAALRRARTTLADELGVDPGPALRALEAEVLAQSPSLDAPVRTVRDRAAALPPYRPAGRPRRRAHGAGRADGRARPRAAGAARRAGRRRRRRGPARPDPRPGRHRQEPAAAGGAPARRRRGRAGPDRPRQPAGAVVRLRCRPAAVRGHPQRPGAARRAAARVGLLGGVGVRRDPGRRPGRAGGRVVRRAARALLADGEPRRAAAGGAGGRRRAVVRHRLAARARLPAAPARGPAGADRRHPAHRRAARRRGAARRAGRGPRDRARCTPGRWRRRPPPSWCATASAPTPTTRSPRPATGPPAATRCCCASCCGPCRSKASAPTRRTPTR